MSNVGNKYKVGVFAVVAFLILVFGLVALGSFKYFRKTYEFMTAVSTSVQGLEKGAKVKMKGVPIGSVDKIQLGPEMKVTYIYMKFDPEAFEKIATVKPEYLALVRQKSTDVFVKRLTELVDQGLRCQLVYGDITGTLFVDIAFFDPKEYPVENFVLPPENPPYIPAVPTATIGGIITQVNKVTEGLAQVNIKELADDVKALVQKSNAILDENEFKKIIVQVQEISENLNSLILKANDVLDKKRVDEVMNNMQATFAKINRALDSIERLSEEARSEVKNSRLADTTEKARTLMDSSDAAVKNLNAMKADLARSIEEFNDTLQAAKDLFDSLERNPNSILTGNPEAPVVNPE
jgi:paraquat-inducible protein B